MKQDGLVTFIEMGTGDTERTSQFFSKLFGWRFQAMGDTGNGWFETPAGKIGLHGDDPGWEMVPYFKVSDLEAAIENVRALGGDAEAIATAEGFGRFSNCKDPQGMRFGLHEPD
ncbi:MAG: VOC family protein [Maricaulaceae bacterium]